ncbi:C40 family peptidase [Frigoribacterium sp. PhB24]|uniref:C40 family peptidase n=1 Tax=Frigoribacterium sp. PhB24 TaxID=2485204 RepID=UPI000F9D8156|nr:C40 family peptidase [Frigoribacterium sp. PhB24]ROS50367.1 cell wall-associated NlpC family hydrolase [Frigoribacterium sp. PhB24]
MSPVTEVLSRIQDIQATIAQLRAGATGATTSATAAAGSSTSATAFADALAGTSGTGSTATSASVDAVNGSVASGSGADGSDVVESAKKYLGVPYVFGGEDRTGMDCSGLVQTVFKDLGVSMPRVVPDQAKMGAEVSSLADAKPGDLLVPKGEGHIVIYLGDGKVLHAPRPGKDVQIVDNWYKDSDLSTIRRIVPAEGAAAPSAVSATAGASAASSGTDLMTAALQKLMSAGVAS